jgi:hypothetical protein
MRFTPPLEDLAHMNLEHYQLRSDQRNALTVASFPMLALYGWNKDNEGEIDIGPRKAFIFDDNERVIIDLRNNKSLPYDTFPTYNEARKFGITMRRFERHHILPRAICEKLGIEDVDNLIPTGLMTRAEHGRRRGQLTDRINKAHAQALKDSNGVDEVYAALIKVDLRVIYDDFGLSSWYDELETILKSATNL